MFLILGDLNGLPIQFPNSPLFWNNFEALTLVPNLYLELPKEKSTEHYKNSKNKPYTDIKSRDDKAKY